LPVVDRRLIGHKFWGNFRSVPGFGRVINLASFQNSGKWQNRRQWLIKCVKWTRGFLGRCLRHWFGMPWKLQAFHNFRVGFLLKCYGVVTLQGGFFDSIQQSLN
jgi:hypothetical protein